MQFKSEAHRRKLADLVKSGEVSQRDFDKAAKATGSRKLPERIKPKAPKGGRR